MGTPIPNKSNETKGGGAGPVTTYWLTPEEIAALTPAKPIPRSHTPPIGFATGAVEDFSPETQRRRALAGHQKRREKGNVSESKISKEQYLASRAAGKMHAQIEEEFQLAKGVISSYWLPKWGLKGITAEKAREMLAEESVIDDSPAPANEAPEPAKTGLIALNESNKASELTAEVERLRDVLASTIGERNQLSDDLKHVELASEYRHAARIKELERAVAELETEREMLLQTIERAATPGSAAASDPVDHPAHYTAGGIEAIDAIEAALTGLSGGQAYNTGAAIKYLWRWSHRGGAEDLRKARWYIDRLLAGLEADVG